MAVILPAAEVPGAAQETTSQDILAAVDGLEADIAIVAAVDFATSAKQDSLEGKVDTLIATDFATSAKQDSLEGKVDTLIATDFATETTLQLIRKWPYATHAKIVPSSDATNDYYSYQTALDVEVGLITVVKATGVTTFSPAKVV